MRGMGHRFDSHRKAGDLQERWKRRESNPRSQEPAGDVEEDADLAQAGKSEQASDDSYQVAETDDDPRPQRGPSQPAERTDEPGVTGSEPPV